MPVKTKNLKTFTILLFFFSYFNVKNAYCDNDKYLQEQYEAQHKVLEKTLSQLSIDQINPMIEALEEELNQQGVTFTTVPDEIKEQWGTYENEKEHPPIVTGQKHEEDEGTNNAVIHQVLGDNESVSISELKENGEFVASVAGNENERTHEATALPIVTSREKTLTSILQKQALLYELTNKAYAAHDGVYVWKLPKTQFDETRDNNAKLYSLPFYTSEGHKFQGVLYPNGNEGLGLGTHVSFNTRIMTSNYENQDIWPFSGKISVVLCGGKIDEYHWDKYCGSKRIAFMKPNEKHNIEIGTPLFLNKTYLPECEINNAYYFIIIAGYAAHTSLIKSLKENNNEIPFFLEEQNNQESQP